MKIINDNKRIDSTKNKQVINNVNENCEVINAWNFGKKIGESISSCRSVKITCSERVTTKSIN